MDKKKRAISEVLWDAWCTISIVGIWPRFVEPNIIKENHLELPIARLPSALENLKILQISDLHLHPKVSDRFLSKMARKIKEIDPDIFVFTGDFLCYSRLGNRERLHQVIQNFKGKYGSFAIFGNHDYSLPVSIGPEGNYTVIDTKDSNVKKGFKALLKKREISGQYSPSIKNVGMHAELIELLQNSPLTVLHNENKVVEIKGSGLNVCGLGEYMVNKCDPSTAYKTYDFNYPGLILVHNPDGIKLLEGRPGDLILSGHTHGGQVNIPGIRNKFLLLEQPELCKGLYKRQGRWIYVNRGIGSVLPFRFFASPEMLIVTLKKGKE